MLSKFLQFNIKYKMTYDKKDLNIFSTPQRLIKKSTPQRHFNEHLRKVKTKMILDKIDPSNLNKPALNYL